MAADPDDAARRGWGEALPNSEALSPDIPTTMVARPGTIRIQLAAETLRLYASGWACFQDYCAERGIRALPAPPDLVAAFLITAGCGRAALARRRAAIDHHHRQFGLPPPGAAPSVRAALRQARRAAPHKPRAAAPSSATLTRMAQACRSDLAGQRDRAILLLLAVGISRVGLVALQAEHLRFTEAGLTMDTSRSDDTRQHAPSRSTSVGTCPVRAMEDWLRLSDTRYGPVFRKVNRWGQLEHAALGADAIRLILARRTTGLHHRRGD